MTDLPGRSAIDPEPEVVSLTTEKNQEGAAHAAEETTKPEPKNPCPHPEEELSHFGDVVICQHCWNVIDRQAEITSEDHETAGEDQAHAVCVA